MVTRGFLKKFWNARLYLSVGGKFYNNRVRDTIFTREKIRLLREGKVAFSSRVGRFSYITSAASTDSVRITGCFIGGKKFEEIKVLG